jgi:hypothetical protein
MTEPTEDEVLVKAKQLARDDGRLWDTEDIEDASAARRRRVPPRRISEPSARAAEAREDLNTAQLRHY